MTNFFGDNFASRPNHFKFQIGDKKLIRIIVLHVNKIVDSGNITHFQSNSIKPNTNEKQMCDDAARTYYFLDKLKANAEQNAVRERGGYRFDDETKKFSTYLRMISGALAYKHSSKKFEVRVTVAAINKSIYSIIKL